MVNMPQLADSWRFVC